MMEIILGVGIAKLRSTELLFGLTEAQAREILGPPDKSYTTEFGCQRLQFNEVMLKLSFEPDNDNLLGWIEVHNLQAILFGKKIVGQPKKAVLEIAAKELGQPSEFEDYGSFESAFYEEQWLELHFEFGRLTNLNFGVLYSEENRALWPALKQ
ncbi:hypothetical protein [Roseofilum casamattae]|uniref:Uncharacterized protein n=1 Tax=Roseofilum casamattae BLCC-M143 TaxID=3022442 RepID=A0ABT7C1F7_9CYAN|nr:hypothetical protein [Roseofilum casamattae]MDJ1184343.1 hypothetical protein [Roseofilum casamattae BLCC-M143]